MGQLVIMQRYEKEPVRFLEGGGHGIGFKRVITRPVSGLTAGIHEVGIAVRLISSILVGVIVQFGTIADHLQYESRCRCKDCTCRNDCCRQEAILPK